MDTLEGLLNCDWVYICCTFSSEESIKPLDLYEMKREYGAEEALDCHESFYARERSL